jgi:O-antigen/teichoic acid export membrane protein
VTASPLPDTDEARGELQAGELTAPFWRTRAWWGRAGSTAIAVYAGTGLAFVATVVVARALGPNAFGQVVLAVAIATLFATLLDLTLEEAVVHHGYRALAQGDSAGILRLIRTSLALDIGIGILVSASVVVLAAPLADLASAGRLDPGLVRLAALVTLVSTADSTTGAVLQVAGRPDLRGWAMAGANLARVLAILVAVQIGTAEAVIVAYAIGNFVGSFGQGLVAWRVARRRWAGKTGSSALRVPIRELMRFGFHSSLTTSVAAANGALIPVILGRVAGPTTVGMFRVAMFPLFVVNSVSGPIRLVLFPEQARLAAHGEIVQLRNSVRTYTLACLAMSLPFAVAGWFVLPWLLPAIFSQQFDDAVLPARILLIAAVVHFCGAWFKTLPAAVGKPQIRTAVTLIELVLTISLLVALGGEGTKGAAIALSTASLISSIVAYASTFALLRREASTVPSTAARPRDGAQG